MKLLLALTLTVLFSLAAAAPTLAAQAPSAGQPPAAAAANPIVWSANQIYERQARNMQAAAEEMPADKFSYSPTPDQMTFGKLVAHVALANGHVCAILSGAPVPPAATVAPTAPKPELLAALKASFDFCDTAMAGLKDSQLSETVTFFRGARVPRARALFELTGDLEDHYSQMAGYLRLNSMLPPSAAPRK
jgi:hypothetical protein